MSKATKRKHVTKEVTEEFILPENDLQIVKVLSSRGNNLHEVMAADSSTFLVSMPTKFRKNVWIKRGDYVMVKPIEEGDRVRGEITHILYKPQISYIQQENKWPAVFSTEVKCDQSSTQMIPDDMLPPGTDSEGSDTDSEGEEDRESDSEQGQEADGQQGQEADNLNPNKVRQQRVTFATSDDNSHKNGNEDSGNDYRDSKDESTNATSDNVKTSNDLIK